MVMVCLSMWFGFACLFWSAICVFLTRSLSCSSNFTQISYPSFMVLMGFDRIWWGENSARSESRCFGSMSLVLSSDSKMFFLWSIPKYFFGHCSNFWFPLLRFEWSFIVLLNGSYFNFSFGSFVPIKILSDLLGFLFTVPYVNFTLEWFD